MKKVVLTKENKKDEKKVFTKKKIRDTMKKDYNPLKVNYRLICKRRDEFYKMKKEILKELKRGFSCQEKLIVNIFPKTFIKAYKKGIEKGFNSRM